MKYIIEEKAPFTFLEVFKRYQENPNVNVEVVNDVIRCDLSESVIALVEAGFDLQKAADTLFVHRNTLRYRLYEKFVDKTGLDCNVENFLLVYFCLKYKEVFNAN